jgi:aspartate 1-decarboxylase
MLRTLMKSKLHRATVTEANLHYMGSVTVDRDLMDAADLLPHERVQVVDIDNGARLETYVIPGERGAGQVCLNGAAARLVQPGDKVIIMSYASYDEAELRDFAPRLVFVDERNRIVTPGPDAAEPGPGTPRLVRQV